MFEVHVNFPNADEASSVARDAVERRYAACANIHGTVHSYYWWDEAVQSAGEISVVFKTSQHGLNALMDFIAASHSYETPGIVVHQPRAAHPAYLDWVDQETRRETR